MSRYDYETYRDVVREFRFHRLGRTFATNSIKLYRANTRGCFVPYIWIDAPWRLCYGDRCMIYSGNYPDCTMPGHSMREHAWLKNAAQFHGGYFLGLRLMHCARFAVFEFSGGWRIVTNAKPVERTADDDYDDWYVRGRSGRSQS
jgi:hypothetical protein